MIATSIITWTCHTCGFPIADGKGVLGVPLIELSRWPKSSPTWRPQHLHCIDPEHDVYGIDVEQIRDASGLLQWTVHLMGKTWLADTNWRGVLATATGSEVLA